MKRGDGTLKRIVDLPYSHNRVGWLIYADKELGKYLQQRDLARLRLQTMTP